MAQFSQRSALTPRSFSRLSGFRQIWGEMARLYGLWRHRVRSRQRLSDLPPHLLRDIGVTPEVAQREAAKPFWR